MSEGGKSRVGKVTGNRMNKTIIVEVERWAIDPAFKKHGVRAKRFKVHDEKNEGRVGDVVSIRETRPLSKEKRWRLQKILVRGESLETPGA